MERDVSPGQYTYASSIAVSLREQMQVTSARLHALETHACDLLWMTTPGGYFLPEDVSWYPFTGQTLEEAARKGWLEIIHPDDRELLEIIRDQCVRTGQPSNIICRVRDAQGDYRSLSLRCVPVSDEMKHVSEIIYLGTSILSDQRASKGELRTEVEHLEATLINMAHDAIIVSIPPNGRILSWNRGATDLYGYSAQEAKGQILYDLLQTRYPTTREDFINTLYRDGKWEGELRLIRKDGRQVVTETRMVVLYLENGQPQAVLSVSRDITERKRTEQLLKEYIQLAETVDQIGMWTWDIAQDVIIFSRSAGASFPIHPDYSSGLSYEQVLQIVHPDDREAIARAMREALEQKEDYINEYRLIHPERGIIWHMAYGRGIYDEQGKPVRMVGVVLDITERKRIEQELHEANKMVMDILESITDAFMYLDKEWRYIYVNSQACRYTGKSCDELIGNKAQKITPDIFRSCFEKKVKIAMDERETTIFDMFNDVTGRWFTIRAYPAKEGITIFASDITERKQIEEALRKSEAKLRRLVEANISGVIVDDMQGVVIEANDEFLRITGYTREDVEKGEISCYKITAPEYQKEFQRVIQELRETGVFQPYEKEYITKQGRRVPVLVAGARIEEGGEKNICFVVDLSKQKALEKQREHFLRLVSHELRTPLTAINGSLQLAQRRLQCARRHVGSPGASAQEALDRLEETLAQSLRQTYVLNRLIDDLVESARITAEKLSLALRPHDLVEIVRHTVQDQRFTVPEREILLADLPASAWVRVDAGRISQVLANLISNALKYSPCEQPVLVGLTLEGAQARVWVRDWGVGLSQEDQQHVWERYFQSKEVQDQQVKSVNLGLGLHLCRLLVEQHGGQVGVQSQLGQGATFWFTLPLSRQHHSQGG